MTERQKIQNRLNMLNRSGFKNDSTSYGSEIRQEIRDLEKQLQELDELEKRELD